MLNQCAELNRQFSSRERYGICPSLAGCLEQISFHFLQNKHISLVLWLKFFDAVVSAAMLFGLATLSLTKGCLQKLGVVQRRILRSIVRWVRIDDDQNWRNIMAQRNHRMAIADIMFPIEDWEDRLFRSKFRLSHRIA